MRVYFTIAIYQAISLTNFRCIASATRHRASLATEGIRVGTQGLVKRGPNANIGAELEITRENSLRPFTDKRKSPKRQQANRLTH